MIWADDLLKEYGTCKRDLERMKGELDRSDLHDKQDLSQINSMIESMTFSMEWLETGRQPGTYKGMDKKGIYQRHSFANMDFIPDITEQIEEGPKQLYMTREEKMLMADIFAKLSLRERQCYILHHAAGKSFAAIAEELNVSRSRVQQAIERARKKISEIVEKKE